MSIRLSIQSLVALVRAAYEMGGGGWDPFNGEDSVPLSDGGALKIIADHLGGVDGFIQAKDNGPRVSVAAIPQEIAEVMEELRNGALLSVGDELRGRELSESFSALVYDLLSDQIEQGDEAGGVQA